MWSEHAASLTHKSLHVTYASNSLTFYLTNEIMEITKQIPICTGHILCNAYFISKEYGILRYQLSVRAYSKLWPHQRVGGQYNYELWRYCMKKWQARITGNTISDNSECIL